MREVILDTETTGLDPAAGHRLVEIGCVELINHLPSGQVFQRYLNPEQPMPMEAFEVHGLSDEFLADKPLFPQVAEAFLAFIGDAPLIIHNADFDMKFLNWELKLAGYAVLPKSRAVDTVAMARRKYPGSPASLDALCRRFGIDNSGREKHGALLDAELLAEVYLELIGGREPGLELAALPPGGASASGGEAATRQRREPRPHAPTAEEAAAHAAFLKKLTNPIWSA